MKILVTGGAGYVGGTVASLLASKGHNPIVFDNLCHSRREEVPAGVEFVQGDLADRSTLENLFVSATDSGSPFDAVLHFAALIEAGESMRNPGLYFRNNTASTLSLLEAVLAKGPKRLVFSSTAAVYGEPESVPVEEVARLSPTNVYGESKLMVEQMLTWFNRIHGLRYASLRYFNVAGAPEGPFGVIRGEAHEPESHLIPLDSRRCPGSPCFDQHLWRRLPYARRHLYPRLHPRLRPGRCSSSGSQRTRTRTTGSSSTWAMARGSACGRSSNPPAASPAIPFWRGSFRAAPAIPLFWSPAQQKRSES